MGWFNKDKSNTPAAPAATAGPVATVDVAPAPAPAQAGVINLSKGGKVTIAKTPVIKAKATWSSATDYDLYALVLMKDGTEHVVSTFGSKTQKTPTPSILNGKIRHLGDVGRQRGVAEETIEIILTDDVLAVVPVAYSAQSNGTGSFRRYKVSLSIDNGESSVTINSNNANNNDTIYSVAIGMITNTPNGIVVDGLEAYSAPGSENRPTFVGNSLYMDQGARNLFK